MNIPAGNSFFASRKPSGLTEAVVLISLALGALLALTACVQTVEAPAEEVEPVAESTSTAEPPATEPPTSTPTTLPTATPSPTPLVEPREGRVFTYYGTDPAVPVVANGPAGRWDQQFINPGGMLVHDGRFHMFRNGFTDWPGPVSVGYMTSEDGLTWREVQEDPVFTSDQVPYVGEGEGADVSSVIVLDDGTWVMYFHLVSPSEPAVIGRASSPSPLGPWSVDPEPMLVPGPDDAWDDGGVAWPSVVKTDAGYHMYYAGSPGAFGDTMIGQATSADGVTWQKHDDPQSAAAPYAESDPVLTGEEELWATQGIDRARVVRTADGWLMVYQGGALVKRGLAFSQDGIDWAVHPDNPVLELQDFPISGTMWDTALVQHEGAYYYYTEIGDLSATDIYLAIHEGPITLDGATEGGDD